MLQKNSCLFILAFIPLLGFGQKVPVSQKHDNKNIINIDLYSAYQKRDNYPLSMVAEYLEYIALETNEKNLLGEYPSKIYLTSNEIFILDFGQAAYRFTREGKFINKIGRIGRGPGGCEKPVDMILDSINKSLILLDHDKLVKYDYNGNFIKNYKLNFTSFDIFNYKNGVFLLNDGFYNYQKPEERFSLRFYSEENEKVISKVACEKKDKIPFSICHPVMYNYNDQTYIKDYWSDTIYHVQDPFNLKAYAFIETGKLKHRDVDDKSVITGKVNPGDTWIVDITSISETDLYIFIISNKGLFIYDKVRQKTFCCNYQKVNNRWIDYRNDLNSGPDLMTFNRIFRISNNIFITYNQALEFFEMNSDKLKPGLDNSLKNLTPNDNQVLVMIRFKTH